MSAFEVGRLISSLAERDGCSAFWGVVALDSTRAVTGGGRRRRILTEGGLAEVPELSTKSSRAQKAIYCEFHLFDLSV